MMILLTAFLLMMITGQSTSEYDQRLLCNYEHKKNVSDTRIWCKRDDQNVNCCTGFAFKQGVTTLEDNKVTVQDDGKSFVVSVLTLTQGEGVYWCGLMDKDKNIIKLNQKHFYTPLDFIWSILRWIIFILLALMFILINIYINKKHGNEENTYEDVRMRVKE